jgi:hypothetical protein
MLPIALGGYVYYLVYKTTNKTNGKFYIGAHATNNKEDDYLGSGVALKRAIEKYGKENFHKEILHECSSREEMFLLEEKLVVINSDISYNMKVGGKGGFDHIDSRGEKNPMKNEETVKKVVETCRKLGIYTSKKRLDHLKRCSEIAAKINTGKKRPEHSKKLKEAGYAKKFWENNKEEMRDKLSTTFEVFSPNGESYITNRLADFCEERNLAYTTLWSTSRTGVAPKRGRSKGWTCKIFQN